MCCRCALDGQLQEELFVLACATMLPSTTTPRCSRCGRVDLFWECVFCREAGLVRSVWRVVLLQVARGGGYAAADVVDRVLRFCGSPCFEYRVNALSDFLRGGPWTYSPFFQLDQEFDAVLHQCLPIPRPRRLRPVGYRLGGSHAGRPGHRGNDLAHFVLSRHIVGFIAPRKLLTRCSCQPVQLLVDVGTWRRCSACMNGVLLDLCVGFGRASRVVDRDRLPSRDDDDNHQILSKPRSSWEYW